MLTTQSLATGSLGELRAALTALSDSGIPPAATIATKRARGGQLTEVSAEWTPAHPDEDDDADKARAPMSGGPPIPPSSS